MPQLAQPEKIVQTKNIVRVPGPARSRDPGKLAPLFPRGPAEIARPAVLCQLLTGSLLPSRWAVLPTSHRRCLLVRAAAVGPPDSLPLLKEIAILWPMFLVALALVVITGTLCGRAPTLACMKTDVLDSLRDGSQSSGQGCSRSVGHGGNGSRYPAATRLRSAASQLCPDARHQSRLSAPACDWKRSQQFT